MDSQALDRKISRLQDSKSAWLKVPVGRRIDYLRSVLRGTQDIAERQVHEALGAKGIQPGTPPEAEEWLSGPVIQVRVVRTLLESLECLAAHGELPLDASTVRVRGNGQVVVEVFPSNTLDKVIYRGLRAEVWMQPYVTPENLRENVKP